MQDGGIRSKVTRSQVSKMAVEKRSFAKVISILQVTAAYTNMRRTYGHDLLRDAQEPSAFGLAHSAVSYSLADTVIGSRYLVHCSHVVSVISALSVVR